LSIPHGLEPGDYRLLVRDILTGEKRRPRSQFTGWLNSPALRFRPGTFASSAGRPENWPQGTWEPMRDDAFGNRAAGIRHGPGHEGLFQRLSIKPRVGKPPTKTAVTFISYPAGFGRGVKPFYEIAQEHRE